jgi:hypothetical protein
MPRRLDGLRLPICVLWTMLSNMVTLSGEDTAAIQRVYDESGELSAAIEVTRRFQAIQGERAREWARMIASWRPSEVQPRPAAR